MDMMPISVNSRNFPAAFAEVGLGVGVPLAELLVLLVEVDFSVLSTPPWIAAGSLLPVTLEAAILNALRVSGPLVLRRWSASYFH